LTPFRAYPKLFVRERLSEPHKERLADRVLLDREVKRPKLGSVQFAFRSDPAGEVSILLDEFDPLRSLHMRRS